MNKYLILLCTLGGSTACSDYPNDYESYDIASDEQELGTAKFAGWNDADGWEHRRCNITDSSNVCYYPEPDNSGGNKWYRKIYTTVTPPAGLPSGVDLSVAQYDAKTRIENGTSNWDFVNYSSANGVDIILSNNESLYSGTPPNSNLQLSQVVHIGCSQYGSPLTENYSGSGHYCARYAVEIDTGAINSWLAQWATVSKQQATWTNLFAHIYAATGTGLGATDAAGSPMYRFIPKTGNVVNFTTFEYCLMNSVNYNDPSYIDPNLGVYTNGCN